MSKKNELSVVASEESLAILRDSYPVESGFQRTFYPRLGMYSQDVTEGKGKAMKVVTEAGMFYVEYQSDEIDPETGKKIWTREEIGTSFEAIILFQRKQLRFYDSANETYTSSPVYDLDDEVLPLFCNKAEVDRGTPAELKSREIYKGKSAKGKDISKLEDNRILYVLYKDKVYQMNLRGTSMYAFKTYKSKIASPNTVLTHMSSEAKENGSIAWNQMTFEAKRTITQEEADQVQAHLENIKGDIAAEKGYFASLKENVIEGESEADRAFRGLK